LEALPDFGANVLGHGDAVFDGDAVDGDERNNVGGAHAGMRALMFSEIDELGGLANAANGGFLNGGAFADESDDATVVIGIHFPVEKINAGEFHGCDNGIDFGRIAAFGEIRNAFNKSARHGKKDNRR
jgi:hypothetical protein